MSRAKKTGSHSPVLHVADRYDLIRVLGARVNNLKDVSVELPKCWLTVFTGVSGSGKSSLVFGTIAVESQRLINEIYSVFLQGFMLMVARSEVDVLDGLMMAIIVDQEWMGINSRFIVGIAIDVNAMLRIFFSWFGQSQIGAFNVFAFNVFLVWASGSITVERGEGKIKIERVIFICLGGMCPRCEGMGRVFDFDWIQMYDDIKSLNEGAFTISGYSMDGWYGRIFSGCGFFDPDKPIKKFIRKELHDLFHKALIKIKVDGINLTYEGLIPKIQKSILSKDVDALQLHVRVFVERVVIFTICFECEGIWFSEAVCSSKIKGINIADACAKQITDLGDWVRGLDESSVALLFVALLHIFELFVEIGLGYLSLDWFLGTLSGGEVQCIKMIRYFGSSLIDVTYVFDEPTIGLHFYDVQRMNDFLLQLWDKGNMVFVVEYEPETIAIADHVVDFGFGVGMVGGIVCYEGIVEGLRVSGSIIGCHFDDRAVFKEMVRTPIGMMEIRGAIFNNLQDVDVDIPLGVFCVIIGVAGFGKSSLVEGSIFVGEGVVSIDQGVI